jgi:hypothetical protein
VNRPISPPSRQERRKASNTRVSIHGAERFLQSVADLGIDIGGRACVEGLNQGCLADAGLTSYENELPLMPAFLVTVGQIREQGSALQEHCPVIVLPVFWAQQGLELRFSCPRGSASELAWSCGRAESSSEALDGSPGSEW